MVNLHSLAAVGIFDQGDGRRRWLACEGRREAGIIVIARKTDRPFARSTCIAVI